MDFTKLENNIIDVIKEEQIKLGYRSEKVRIYYPLLSLNRFLSTDYDSSQMQQVLQEYCNAAEGNLGAIEVFNQGERFCFIIPPEGSDYVHEHLSNTEFIYDFIKTIEKHGCTMEEVLSIFHRHSDCVHVERMENGEFDYLIYFEDGIPDKFRYCITDEGCHISYHRFTADDYMDIER